MRKPVTTSRASAKKFTLTEADRRAARRICGMVAERQARDRLVCIEIGRAISDHLEQKNLPHGVTGRFALAMFGNAWGTLRPYLRLYQQKADLADADDLVAKHAPDWVHEYPHEPDRSLKALRWTKEFRKKEGFEIGNTSGIPIEINANGTDQWTVLTGQSQVLLCGQPDKKFKLCIYSPPQHQMRDYGNLPGEIGNESTVEQWLARMVQDIGRQIHRVLDDRGVMIIVCGDRVARGKTKAEGPNDWRKDKMPAYDGDDLPAGNNMDLPGRLARALQLDGWMWRSDISWAKTGQTSHGDKRPQPNHDRILMFAKSMRYDFDQKAVQEPTVDRSGRTGAKGHHQGRIRIPKLWKGLGSVWPIAPHTRPHGGRVPFPLELVRRWTMYVTKEGDYVLDPFSGTGTTGVAAKMLGRRFVGMELNPEFADYSRKRIAEAPDHPLAHWNAPQITTDTRAWLPPLILANGNKVIHGDALTEIRKLPDASVDFIPIDPPYGDTTLDWDEGAPWDELWPEFWRVLKPDGFIAICCDDRLLSHLIQMQPVNYRFSLKWFKGNFANFMQGRSQPAMHIEFIAIFGKVAEASYTPQMVPLDAPISRTVRKVHRHLFGTALKLQEETHKKVFRAELPIDLRFYEWEQGEKITFETQKPIAMGLDLIPTYARIGGVILDLFTGSGTFACEFRSIVITDSV
jgi:DNA modification methylase